MTTLIGTISKITTLIDGSWRISFDVDESQGDEVLKVAKLRDKVVFISVISKKDKKLKEENGQG